jgi:hypothetical protein
MLRRKLGLGESERGVESPRICNSLDLANQTFENLMAYSTTIRLVAQRHVCGLFAYSGYFGTQ